VEVSSFTFVDGERLIRFGEGALAEAPALLAERGFDGYALLTTERALASAPPTLVAGAEAVLRVPAGRVPQAAAAVRTQVGGRPLVALGGGRVTDVAKAIAGADRLECAAIPTTLAGSPFTPFHRMPAGVDEWRLVRPSLVVAEPRLMASMPGPGLVATAMNALAHAMESLYTPRANPVAEMAALRAAALLTAALPGIDRAPAGPPSREEANAAEPEAKGSNAAQAALQRSTRAEVGMGSNAAELSLAALLGGYAIGTTGLAVHHGVCQTIVRTCDTPHAETNAVMLPHTAGFVAGRAPRALGKLARALGHPTGDPASVARRVAALAVPTGVNRLSDLGVTPQGADDAIAAAGEHPALQNTPGGVTHTELRDLLHSAL